MTGKEVEKWADEAMFEAAPGLKKDDLGRIIPRVHLIQATPDPLGSVAAMCRMYEGKPTPDLQEITREERLHYWEQVKKTHLKAPLESVVFHFFIEGVTRSWTHQHVRQRTAVYAQESLRFAVKSNLKDEVGYPPSLVQSHDEAAHLDEIGAQESRKELAQAVWDETIQTIERAYKYLIDMGFPAEDARELLPHATTTRTNYVTNLRALIDHAGNRLCTQAQFQWRFVFTGMVDAIRHYETETVSLRDDNSWSPTANNQWQFRTIADDGVFKPVCYQLGHCPFTADFDRKCSIRKRVQAGEFDKIDDREWLMDPEAAR